jgi:malonate-semialdehyde dehydrogenase (acetylating)/methylmalonate-semialdehyde dehydrogenase
MTHKNAPHHVALNFIGGEFVSSSDQSHIHSIHSPLTGETMGEVHFASNDFIHRAIPLAASAQKSWGASTLKERCQVMFNLRQILLDQMEELALVISYESGKTLAEAKAEIFKGVEVIEFASSLQNLDSMGRMEVSKQVTCEILRRPLGVVSAITPFNFPAMVPLWMMPIAITLGNSFIWKPSEKTPLTSYYLGKAFKKAQLPDGVLTILQGSVAVSQEIMKHHLVKAIGFVGSTPAAQDVYRFGTHHLKRVLALGGAKNHIILLPDADVEMAASGIVDSFTGCAGQRCMAASVLLTVGDCSHILKQIVIKAKEKKLVSQMGAIISKQSLEFLHKSIQKGLDEGAELLLDGRKCERDLPMENKQGHFLAPTILSNVKPGSFVAEKELFGPVLSVIPCKNLEEAFKIENASTFGNAASIFTSSGAMETTLMNHGSAGMMGVNVGVPVPREPFSFGGINQSKFGHGDITGVSSLDFWSDLIKITKKWPGTQSKTWMD